MSSELELLLRCPIFDGLTSSDFEGVELLWETRTLSQDEFLWYQGQPAHELAIVVDGTLKAQINQQVLGEIHADELVGELAVFTKNFRSASIVAATDTRLLLLSKESVEMLRDVNWTLYNRLLNLAFHWIKNYLLTNLEIAKRSKGTDSRVQAEEPSVGFNVV